MNKRTQCLNSDVISTLPQNIIENIPTLMPLRDALRTSILSKNWRYTWRSMPKLVFTDTMVKPLKKYKLVNAIFHVLLLHNGPTIVVFNCSVSLLDMVSEFEQILSHLSKGNNVKELTFVNDDKFYTLPVNFFSLQGLESIHLQRCSFEPPLTFNRFSLLKSMTFSNVEVSAKTLQGFLFKCPVLEHIHLIGRQKDIDFVASGSKFTFIDLLQCVPLIKTLDVSRYYMKYLCAGGMPHKLPTLPVHLQNLFLDVCMTAQTHISSALSMIRSSPSLVKIDFQMFDNKKWPIRQTPLYFLDPEDQINLNLDRLELFEIGMNSTCDRSCETHHGEVAYVKEITKPAQPQFFY